MLTSLGSIAAQQVNPTNKTVQKLNQLLVFAATYTDAVITYRTSEMVLTGHKNASYLYKTKSRIREGGKLFMPKITALPTNNGAVFTIYKIIKAVMSSAAEAELGALFINSKEAIPERQPLEEMGHRQPQTPTKTDNTTAHGVVTNNIASKRLKSMDTRIHWLRCRETHGKFCHYWRAGSNNLRDYFTKHHAEIHHQRVRPTYLTPKILL